jgi:AAA domain
VEFKEASKIDTKIKMAFSGLSGAGKSLSGGLFWKGFLSNISDLAVVQTEHGRIQLYADRIGKFKVLEVEPPFTPIKLIECIDAAEKANFKALQIESLSDFWAGLGGVLDMHSAASEVTRNSFTAWKKITPQHEALFNKILSSPLHILCTLKKKSDYIMEEKNGKMAPKKVGLADVAREGTEYRWMLQFEIERETHLATASKDNTGLFDGAKPFLITEETGRKIREWCLAK